MRTFIFEAAFWVGVSTSLSFADREAYSPAVVGFHIERQTVPLSGDFISRRVFDKKSDMHRRGVRVKQHSITNMIALYTSKVYVGAKNPQEVTLQVDTGSSDFFMIESSAKFWEKSNCGFGTFSAQKSQSFKPIKQSVAYIKYYDGTEGKGIFATDTINVSGITLPDFQFALVTQINTDMGLIDLGYPLSQKLFQPSTPLYSTFPEALMNAGKVNLNAYSLWLNGLTATTGFVLYGGVDTAKFVGKLATLSVAPPSMIDPTLGPIPELLVYMNSASFEGAQSSSVKVLLDYGYEVSFLPADIVNAIYIALDAKINSLKWAWVDCSLKNSDRTIDFDFGSESQRVVIRVPLSQMVYERDDGRPPLKNAQRENLCNLLINPVEEDDVAILGSSFLRYAFVVFDLSNDQISIAQASFSGGSKVIEIPPEGVISLGL